MVLTIAGVCLIYLGAIFGVVAVSKSRYEVDLFEALLIIAPVLLVGFLLTLIGTSQ